MESHYFYQCINCQQKYPAEKIEENLFYLCPSCGKAGKNEPLRGVLNIVYDYDEIRRKISREHFLRLPAGIPWLYPQLLPLEYDVSGDGLKSIPQKLLRNLVLPSNQILTFEFEGTEILILDDTRNPTFSYKDRASILVALKALQMGIREISAASTGNAGSSLAGICARTGLKARIWVPESIPLAKLLQIQSYSAQIHLVKGDYDSAFDLSLEIGGKLGWYNRNTAYNPLTIEGKKSAAFDLFIQMKGKLPDLIFVPVGDGVIISGIYKGLRELVQLGWIETLPRLVAVQSTGSDALVRYLRTGKFEYREANTLADSISAGAPRNLFMAAEAVRKSDGIALAVSDEAILNAQKMIAEKAGLLAEPAAAATFAAYGKMKKNGQIENGTNALLLMTGSGLKDVGALQKWNTTPEARSAAEWKDIFGVK
ncbi:MAG: pyridoxal-phosphate dependent enzyme [Calditrichaeota bacterium]|nr:pyridoxal-phosphate dependent enzyme [Calditrichota bacterium]